MEVAIIGPDDKIELKPVKLGRNLGTEVEVVKGLTASDRLVNSPPDSLSTGDKVRIAGQPAADNANVGRPSDSGAPDLAAAPESKPH